MRDLDPGQMAFARDVNDGRAFEGPGAPHRKIRCRPGQRTKQRGVVRFGSAGCEVTRSLRRKPGAAGDSTDYVSLDLNRDRRGGRSRELRIERAGNPIRALSGERGGRIEQAEVARMRDVDETMLHLVDSPGQQFVERTRRLENRSRRVRS